MGAYERLWRTAGTDGLSELFADDAVYSMAPYEEPVQGLRHWPNSGSANATPPTRSSR